LALVGLVLFSGPEAQAGSKAPEIGIQGQSVAAQAQAMMDLYKQLSASPRATVQHSVVLTADEADILTHPGVDSTGLFRVGVHRAVGKTVSNMGADLVVRIPGAPAVRLELTKVKGTVAVFNDAGEAHEYTEDGFTHTFSGDEVRVRGSAYVSGAGAVNLGGNLCDFNAPCTENADCASMPTAIDTARNAYASILFISGHYYYLCSGGLIADSDPETEIPYFLTANHCISMDREASSVETRFQYTIPCGTNNLCDLFASDWDDTVGSTIMATNSSGDFTLLELADFPPDGSVYLGWDSTPVADENGVQLYRISHPGGAPQAYSEHVVDTSAPTCLSWPRGERIYSRDIIGATEGGSSGSPVLNAQAQVVGQLSGACGYNVNDECDNVNNATVDGAFAYYYPEVQPFLGDGSTTSSTTTTTTSSTTTTTTSSTTTTQPSTNTCAYPDKGNCNADPNCEWIGHPKNGTCQEAVSCVPDEETEFSCADDIDNDCDGFTDCADIDCINNSSCTATCDYLDRKTCQAKGCTWNNRDKVCSM